MLWVDALARKSDVFGAFQRFKATAENEPTALRIRINRTIVEGLISLLNQAQAPKGLWAEALLAFVFVKNRSLHAALTGGVPLSVWHGKPRRARPFDLAMPALSRTISLSLRYTWNDFLGNDPFGTTLAEVEALYSAVGEDLSASNEHFSLPTSDPCKHRKAVRDTDSKRWRLGQQNEFASLQTEYNVFHPVNRSEVPPDAKILGAHFVYQRKKDQNGQVTGHKVRLVAQGFTQRPNVDFRETFAPVVKFTLIRILLALATRHRLHVHQWMSTRRNSMARSRRSSTCAYREASTAAKTPARSSNVIARCMTFKQAGRVWNHRIHATLEGLGYRRTKSDACIYVCSEGGHTHYVALYVDDLLFVSPDLDEIQRIKDGLKCEYGIKDLGEAKFILGIQVHHRSNGGLFLSQRAYLKDVLPCLGYANGIAD
ncbi:hypothetical protein JCM3774_004151, partial [Rhodotorula dairenensis]